jgi:hypothetical protein
VPTARNTLDGMGREPVALTLFSLHRFDPARM